MTALRWRKLARDLWRSRGRTAAMVISIALSVATVAALLTVRAVLDREVAANYLAGRPASATLHLAGPAGPAEPATAAAVSGVTAATVRGTVTARVRVGQGPWRAMVLFVSTDTDPGRLARAAVEAGTWPPAVGQIFVERTALPYLATAVGRPVQVRTAAGAPVDLTVAGTVHDAGVAPAYQERTVYARATTSSVAALLGSTPTATNPLDELLIEVGSRGDAVSGDAVSGDAVSGDAATVSATAQKVAAALAATGHPVTRIDVPPPLRHPHYGQMVTVGWVMLAFGLAALLLSSVLVATLLGGLITGQVRQIGAMKAVGATTRQVFALYLSLVLVIAAVATTVAVWPGLLLGRLLAGQAAALLNLDLTSTAVPGWVTVITLATGVVVPVLVAVPPLVRGSRRTVREAIDDHGVGGDDRGRSARALSRLTRLSGLGRTTMLGRDAMLGRDVTLAMRNLARRPGRLALTVALMAVAGALFVTGLNAANGWDALVGNGIATRHYDLEVRLARPLPAAELSRLALAVPGVTAAQSWPRQPVTVARPGQVDATAEYPDEAHGSFALLAVPPETDLIRLPVRSGRWLRPDDGDALVLTSLAAQRQLPGAVVGDTVRLTVAGRLTSWRLVGIVTDFGSQATAYVSTRGYAQAIPDGAVTASGSSASMVRVVTSAPDAAGRAEVLARLSEALDAAGVPVASALAVDDLKAALDGHVFVLIEALVAVALLIAVVALLGLATVMSTSVTERTRELAVMQVVGATPGALRSMVLTEGLLTAGAAVVIAVTAAVPLTALFGSVIGRTAFLEPLPFRFSPGPVLAWLLVSLVGAALATTAAARAAGRLTVREALTTL
jgi:putative ABC transport system permease protein